MSQSSTYTGTSDYIAAPDLMQTVNVAVQLSRPLLIKGEPGTGKTMLAQSIARGLEMPLIVWNVKSTSKAQDGLYLYDTVQRLYDGQFGDRDVSDIAQYIRPGKLGEALNSEGRVVVLSDEIDKAEHRPIVLITPNAEKELPYAFLRRCVLHYIESPDEEMMERVVPGLQRKPSTSELIHWVQAPARGGVEPEEIAARLLFMIVLLKKDDDVDVAQRALSSGRRR